MKDTSKIKKSLEVSGKRVLVTGASGFLGKIICEGLRHSYIRVVATDVVASDKVKKLDITDPEKFEQFSSDIVPEDVWKDGYLDGIINNAALSFKGNTPTANEFMKTLDANIHGTYNCITKFKHILSPDASIINIASIYGMLSPDFKLYDGNESLYNSSAYGASKAAVIQLTKYYAAQYAPIRVNCISPGGIFQNHDNTFVNKYSTRVPLGRMADPEEIVNAILFLLSPMSSYITGHNLVVDGGLSAM